MKRIDVDMLIQAVRDSEKSRYEILAELKRIDNNFYHNRLYPDLNDIISSLTTMISFNERLKHMTELVPKNVKGVDPEHLVIEFQESQDSDLMKGVHELIEWALPRMKRTVDEGKTIYDFVEENFDVDVVGILPQYVDEGYFVLPDHSRSSWYVLSYEVTLFHENNSHYRSLRTSHVEVLYDQLVDSPPSVVKSKLREFKPELPNPVVFRFDTDLDFDFYHTMLPVAQRLLMRTIKNVA